MIGSPNTCERLHSKECAVATKTAGKTSAKRGESTPADVETFLAALDHPLKPEILALRQVILGADPSITEGIKWNVPSFRTSEYFATMHLRAKDGIQVILHLGAKTRGTAITGVAIAIPDRCLSGLRRIACRSRFAI
jgi:hypothetical protein